jgi:CRP-like cAMP-binding protein
MAVAVRVPRGRLFEQAAAPGDVSRACAAVVLPAGVQRSAAELPAARLLIVENGVVLMRSLAAPGRRSMILARCAAGAVVPVPGEQEFLQSLTDAWLTAVSHAAWRRLVAVPEIAEQLVAGLEETLVRQREAARSFAGIRNVDRVRHQLLELAREHGRVSRDGIRIDLPVTHDLIADMVGCARETVTRAFEDLHCGRFVERRGASYYLLVSPESLWSA